MATRDEQSFDVVVIGGGIAGQTAALALVDRGLHVALVEQDIPGRRHARTGDLMLQVISRAGALAARVRLAEQYGVLAELGGVNYSQLVRRRDEVVDHVLGGRPTERLEAAGIRVVAAKGRLRGPGQVEADGRILYGRAILLATGSQPRIPAVPGLREAGFLLPETVLAQYHLPHNLLVLGGGAVGVSFAQAFGRFGSWSTIVELASRLLPDAEPEVSAAMSGILEGGNVRVLAGWEVQEIRGMGMEHRAIVRRKSDGEVLTVDAEAVLVAAGREPAVDDLGLDQAGVGFGARGVLVDGELQTGTPGIWACGDVIGVYHLANMAAYEAGIAADNVAATLSGHGPLRTVDYAGVPWTYPTDPEVAQIGLREDEARERGRFVVVGLAKFSDLARAVTLGEPRGVVKVVADATDGRILGVHIVGPRAGELISEAALALHARLTVSELAETPHPALAVSEALRRAAASAASALT